MLKFKKYTIRARQLRVDGPNYEKVFWKCIRNNLIGYKFKRQFVIENYIVDFVCLSKKLVIELDGWGHFTKEGIKKDQIRDTYLNKRGYKVIRIKVDDVFLDLEGVIERLKKTLNAISP